MIKIEAFEEEKDSVIDFCIRFCFYLWDSYAGKVVIIDLFSCWLGYALFAIADLFIKS